MGQLNVSIIGIIGAQIISVFLNKDPLSIYIPQELLKPSLDSGWLALVTLRLIWITLFVYMDWQSNCAIIFSSIVGLRIVNSFLVNVLSFCKSINLTNRPASVFFRFQKVIKYHRILRVIEKGTNEAYFVLHPFLLLFGMTTLVVCNYGTVRLYGRISILVYFVLPLLSVLLFGIIQTLFPVTSNAHERSCDIIRAAKYFARTKYLKTVVRAEAPFKIYAGSLFFVKRNTKVTYIALVLDNTITALISSELY